MLYLNERDLDIIRENTCRSFKLTWLYGGKMG